MSRNDIPFQGRIDKGRKMRQNKGFFGQQISLKDKVAIVTGASRGIGRAIAIELAKNGVHVLINYNRQKEKAEEVKAEAEKIRTKAEIFQSDIGDLSTHGKMLNYAVDRFGKVDILVNNAGITHVSDILEEKPGDYDKIMRVNLRGPHFLTQLVANQMVENKISGCIVYILSISDHFASDNRPAYCISKAGLAMDMQLYAGRLAEHSIKVNGVEAGVIDTDMSHARIADYEKSADKGYFTMYRTGSPEDVAQGVIYAMKIYETGAIVPATGGILGRYLNLRTLKENCQDCLDCQDCFFTYQSAICNRGVTCYRI